MRGQHPHFDIDCTGTPPHHRNSKFSLMTSFDKLPYKKMGGSQQGVPLIYKTLIIYSSIPKKHISMCVAYESRINKITPSL